MLRYLIPTFTIAVLPAAALSQTSYRYAFQHSHYDVQPGGHVIVPVYFEETADTPAESRLMAENGLASISLLIERVSGPGASIASLNPNVLFDDPVATKSLPAAFPSDSGSIYGQMLDPLLGSIRTSGLAAEVDAIDPNTRRILIGEVRFDATGLPGQTAAFQASMLNEASDAWTWDGLFFSLSATPMEPIDADDLTITIIPEPGAVVIAGLSMLLIRRRPRPPR